MIYKVLYQENPEEVPVRERTQAMYVEAESERKIRKKLSYRNVHIEHIILLSENHLEYEKRSKDFEVENL
ncbi:DNA-dependent RNA polymerase auxiliary subunit epsilon [Salinibacillus kushneri]|uniref:DNA-directed RNA polymerase subunit epsilon n=1 Tax=Salinibacillus kushneri TaxID=237682 RepID=A0A1I0I6W3_9BACI|nr:RNA polymerase epsilon subunit [Salinibacillus kushneri]SET92374.1 DNA-dependent RNA polymerase auxiliary subunit epsilon [Salinibacillus kushneri]